MERYHLPIEMEKLLRRNIQFEETEIQDLELKLIFKTIQDFAPEIAYLYQFREDESEELQVKTGRLNENRILGIFLKFYLEGKNKITTTEVEEEYKRYFKEIGRSTTSTYMNMLTKESTLYKERDGRIVYYIFYRDPPIRIKPFWFTRVFCIVPAYFDRAYYFSNLYSNPEKYIQQYANKESSLDQETLERNFKFITGLIILNIFKNRSSKCVLCQFSKREIYTLLEKIISSAIKHRSDVLSESLLKNLIETYSEIPIFNGTYIKEEVDKEKIVEEIVRGANIYKKDLDFQIKLLLRRKDLRLNEKKVVEKENVNL